MSYTIARKIRYNPETDIVEVYGACNNVTPRHFEWGRYPVGSLGILQDIISGGVKLSGSSNLAKQVLSAANYIKAKHIKKYPTHPIDQTSPSIGFYSIFNVSIMRGYTKQEHMDRLLDLSHIIESAHEQRRIHAKLYDDHYDELTRVYKEYEAYFTEKTGIGPKVKQEATLFD